MTYPQEGGTWYGADKIETSSGRAYDFVNPVPEDLLLSDIAYSLSTMNRFGGHAKPFWSVAQHSVLVVEILLAWGVTDELILQAALLHDSPEAFLLDIPRPSKPRYGEPYKELTNTAEEAIAERFGIPQDLFDAYAVKQADHLALVNEGHRVMRNGPPPEELRALPNGMKLPRPWPMWYARRRFMKMARKLGLA